MRGAWERWLDRGASALRGRMSPRAASAPTGSASTITTNVSAPRASPRHTTPASGCATTLPSSAAAATACVASCWTSTPGRPTKRKAARSPRSSSCSWRKTRIQATRKDSLPSPTSTTRQCWTAICWAGRERRGGAGAGCRRRVTPSRSLRRPRSASTIRRHPARGGSRCARQACRARPVSVHGARSPQR